MSTFLEQIHSFFSQDRYIFLKPREQSLIKINVPFTDEIYWLTMIKFLDLKISSNNMVKVKFIKNVGFLDVTKNSSELLISSTDESQGMVDLRSIWYYQKKQNILQHNLKPHYKFRQLQVLCEEFNTFTNTLNKEEQHSTDVYHWLTKDNEISDITDKEMLEKYVDQETSCFSYREKEEIMNMLYRGKDTPSFIRPYHVKEVDKQILDYEMKRLYHLSILKEGVSAYSSQLCYYVAN